MSRITLRDVANEAGVSTTTVSNVVRGWPHISDETRHKVEDAIRKLGYLPHPIAQGLRTGHTQVIGFIVPDLANPHFASMVSVAEDIAHERGYCILVCNTHEDPAREAVCVNRVVNGWGDGLLLVQTGTTSEAFASLVNRGLPFVAMDRVPLEYAGAFCSVDNAQLVRQAMEHFHSLGHRRIAHLAGPSNALTACQRATYYAQVCEDLGVRCQIVSNNGVRWSSQEGYDAMRSLLDSGDIPTAVFASNDRMAIGAMRAIAERGLRIPDDISVVGVDDIEAGAFHNPPLTTIRQPVEEMTRASIEMLLKLINNQIPSEIQVSLAPSLVVRQTTARLKEAV